MLFLVGPRQVGKTTTSLNIAESIHKHFYVNWDSQEDRKLILQGPDAVAAALELQMPQLGEGKP
ncbi:MAG TPA: AAA family ATPase, partial [Chlamydiales bacterium]